MNSARHFQILKGIISKRYNFQIEREMKLKEHLIRKNPALKSFLRNKAKTVTESAIVAFAKLSNNDGHTSSLHAEFKRVCKASGNLGFRCCFRFHNWGNFSGKKKKIGIYKERRFTKLGYNAGAIVYHRSEFVKLIEETTRTNELVNAARTYLTVPEIFDFFTALSICTEKVCLPFLKLTERLPQDELVKVLNILYEDLKNQNLNSLQGYCQGFNLNLPEDSTNVKYLCQLMASKMAECLSLQRGREYGFGQGCNKERATNVAMLPALTVSQFPTNNLACERDLAVMDRKYHRSGFTQTGDSNSKCKLSFVI